jgi:hypothetical protein
MDFEAFMGRCRAQWPEFDNWARLADLEHPRDRYLATLLQQIDGMASENKLMLLNLAVASLEPNEIYVEIGSWKGLSVAGAAWGNTDKIIYACDNFSQFGGPREDLIQTLKLYTVPGQVRFYDMDFRHFLGLAPWAPARVGAYFYDGGHRFEEHYKAFQYVFPWLSDDAIIVVDDTNEPPVRAANSLFAGHVPTFHLITDVRTSYNGSPSWWNGVQVYRFCSGRVQQALPPVGIYYLTQRLFWDNVIPSMHSLRRTIGQIPGAKILYRFIRHVISEA